MVSFTKKWLLPLLSATLFSCSSMREEIAPQALVEQPSKLVVDCFISPQDALLTAKVSRSRPILDNNAAKSVEIADALVTLSNGTASISLTYNAQLGLYSADAQKLPIRPGMTYTLSVRTPSGQQVTATTSVPTGVSLKSVRIDSLSGATVQKEYRLVGNWQPTTSSYFRVKGTITGSNQGASDNIKAILFALADNSLGLVASLNTPDNLSVSASLGDESLKKYHRSAKVSLDLLHVEEAYYQYHLALDRQLKEAANPFAEAVRIPTNIQGGLGCFSSYNRSTLTVALK